MAAKKAEEEPRVDWGRMLARMKKLTSKQRQRLDEVDAECKKRLAAYIKALQAKGALEVELGVVKVREVATKATATRKR